MNLWIRSQTNHLISLKDNDIYYKEADVSIYVEPTDTWPDGTKKKVLNEAIVKTYGIYNNDKPLGAYLTEERALEVLDEIQSYLIPKIEYLGNKDLLGNDCKFYDINNIQTLVYEMPKE